MTVATEVDLTGLKCPMPIVHLNRVVRDVPGGHELAVSADDPAFELDIAAWCRRSGHELRSIETAEDTLKAMIVVSHPETEAE